jgi:hypothetical protein
MTLAFSTTLQAQTLPAFGSARFGQVQFGVPIPATAIPATPVIGLFVLILTLLLIALHSHPKNTMRCAGLTLMCVVFFSTASIPAQAQELFEFTDGEVIEAEKFNVNFQTLDSAILALQVQIATQTEGLDNLINEFDGRVGAGVAIQLEPVANALELTNSLLTEVRTVVLAQQQTLTTQSSEIASLEASRDWSNEQFALLESMLTTQQLAITSLRAILVDAGIIDGGGVFGP